MQVFGIIIFVGTLQRKLDYINVVTYSKVKHNLNLKMIKIIIVSACIALLASSLHIQMHRASLSGGKVSLKSDTGKYLARCNNCGPGAYPDTAAVHESNSDNPWATWTLEKVGDQVAFKSDSGKYLSRCNNCWSGAAYPDSAFVHITALAGNPYALWTPVDVGNGKWAFKADTGRFLARCNNCVSGSAYPDNAFVHSTSSSDAFAQWTIEYKFPTGPVNLQADSGNFLARCNNCGPGAYPDTAAVHESNGANSWAIWTAEKVGNQVAFKSDSGKYLSRCNNCWSGAAYPDSAFVHITALAGNPYALWTPENLGNGKWALKGDNGKYLARCNNCVSGSAYPDNAFVHSTSSGDAFAQWTITQR